MKTPQQIEDEIAILEEKRKSEKALHSSIAKLDLQKALATTQIMAKTEGKITALKWVLNGGC